MKASHALILLALGAGALALAGQVQAQAQPAGGKEHARQAKKAAHRQMTSAQREDDLFAQLGLSPDQQTQVQALRQKYDQEPGKGKAPTRDELKKLHMQRDEEIAKILTPEQRTKWEALNAKHAGGGAHRGAGGLRKASASGSTTSSGGGK